MNPTPLGQKAKPDEKPRHNGKISIYWPSSNLRRSNVLINQVPQNEASQLRAFLAVNRVIQ